MGEFDSSPLSPRAALVHRLAASLGFALVGIAPAQPSDHADELRAWLDAGKHGDMDYLAKFAGLAADPQSVLPGVRSIICVGDWYGGDGHESLIEPDTRHPTPDARGPTARIARYAQGDDYHRVMKDRLHQLADALRAQFPDHLFRTTVDTAPLPEREHASRAGLGWVGKHTLLIHPHHGSWFLLGEVLTTLPLATAADAGFPPPAVAPIDRCGSCTRCIDACPTQCITPYSVDGSRCISYLTIEHRGEIDPSLHPLMQDWIAGCDVCQQVCPYNERQQPPEVPEGRSHEGEDADRLMAPHRAYAPRLRALPLLDVLNWTEEDRRAAFKRSALKRIKLDMIKRNALIAAGNHLASHVDGLLRGRIEAIANDENETDLVRVTARQVLARLASPTPLPLREG